MKASKFMAASNPRTRPLRVAHQSAPIQRIAPLADPSGNSSVSHNGRARCAGHNLFEQLKPFAADAVFERSEPGRVAARAGHTRYVTRPDRLRHECKHDRHRTGTGRLREHSHGYAARG